MSRIIREHYVFGKEIRVYADSEDDARTCVRSKTSSDYWIWEIKLVNGTNNVWDAYVAKHEDCFACND